MNEAQQIIQEALEYRYNEDRRSRQSDVDKLFDFSTWGRGYEKKGTSSTILYLTEQLISERAESKKWYKTAEVYRAEAMKYAGMLSPMGAREMEIRAEEKIKERL